jgi:hypothetical protein
MKLMKKSVIVEQPNVKLVLHKIVVTSEELDKLTQVGLGITLRAVFFYMLKWSNLAKCRNIDVAFMY